MSSSSTSSSAASTGADVYELFQGLLSITVIGNALEVFHKFPELPIELRDKIWGFAIFPRLVEPSEAMLHLLTHIIVTLLQYF